MRILITGITGNLGSAAKEVFGRSGWEVVGLSRKESGFSLVEWEKVNQFIAHSEPFDVVFMTHGTQKKVLISEFNENAWNEITDNNLKSAAVLSSALLKYEKLNPGALVVYCSSIQATQPRAGRGLYAMAKSGLEALTRAMAVEIAPQGRSIALRLGQMENTMQGISFTAEDEKMIKHFTPLPWVGFDETCRLVLQLYYQPAISGVVYELDSLHHLSVWPQ